LPTGLRGKLTEKKRKHPKDFEFDVSTTTVKVMVTNVKYKCKV